MGTIAKLSGNDFDGMVQRGAFENLPPMKIEQIDTYDMIVIGAGGSGLAAACSAAQHGASVLVLEKQPQPCPKSTRAA
jgi:NADPH-dependent 2,4-dienoyl-CoA reductase/sulfur reductase-like enzyme